MRLLYSKIPKSGMRVFKMKKVVYGVSKISKFDEGMNLGDFFIGAIFGIFYEEWVKFVWVFHF